MALASTSIRILFGTIAIAIGARLSWEIPGSDVPLTFQTLAVVCVGAWLGALHGAGALALYVALGSAGAPVFSDGGSGWQVLAGPTGGYLVGFVVAAAWVGACADRAWFGRIWVCPVSMLTAHLLLLGFGAARLASFHGMAAAIETGVQPFLLGALIKSALGFGIVVGAERFAPRYSLGGSLGKRVEK